MAEVAIIPAYILSNEYLLHWMLRHSLDTPLETDKEQDYLQECAYVDFHRRNAARPDHVFLHQWQSFSERYLKQNRAIPAAPELNVNSSGRCSIVLACLECLVDEFLVYSHGGVHVRVSQFGWWQNMLSRMSSLPIQAHALWRLHEVAPAFSTDHMDATPALLYPYDEGVENYIAQSGLNDSHVHVNLAATAEVCWLYALQNLDEEIKAQTRSYRDNRLVRELYQEIYADFTPQVLRKHLSLARRIRSLLKSYADVKSNLIDESETQQQEVKYSQCDSKTERQNRQKKDLSVTQLLAPLSGLLPQQRCDSLNPKKSPKQVFFRTADVLEERRWLCEVLQHLSFDPNPLVDRLTHIYILLLNEFSQLCVQQEDKYGFRQFNKYSQAVSSFSGEVDYYEHIFLNMHGAGFHSVTNYAELRIAPKGSSEETQKRILHILQGYLMYLLKMCEPEFASEALSLANKREQLASLPGEVLRLLDEYLSFPRLHRRVVRPAIVLHLIKTKNNTEKEIGEVRFGRQRRQYFEQLEQVRRIFESFPTLRKWVRGIDAAADEMDTPPDTFAPAYRYARHNLGIHHATYHAGEDFYHLISGIRNVYDAVHILEYRRGDRIGHATALGIDPALWMRTMPDSVAPTRGEWLQDLVFLWSLLHECENMHDLARRLDYDIREHGYAVFHSSSISPYLLKRVFELRKLDPLELLFFYKEKEMSMTDMSDERSDKRTCDDVFGSSAWVSRIGKSLERDKQSRQRFSREEQMVRYSFHEEAPEILTLLMSWFFDKETWARADKRIDVRTDYLSVEQLVLIQQMTMKYLVKKGVVIETLPSSNLRIGQYREMGQHHSTRWLGATPLPGDTPPPIVLGTDDPGVFATDIKAEFYHIYASLCKRGLNSQTALEKIIAMNQCGARYAFRSLLSNMTEMNLPGSVGGTLSSKSPGFCDEA